MSVINQMLKDIDDRKREKQTPATKLFSPTKAVSGQKISLLKVISLMVFVIVLVVLITAAIIYKFDFFNTNQDATEVSAIPISQDNRLSESSNQITELKINKALVNDELNVQSQDSSTIKNAITEDQLVVKQEVTKEVKLIEESPDVDNVTAQDIINSAPEISIIKSATKINLKVQSDNLFKQAQSNLDRGNVPKAKQLLLEALDVNVKNHRARLLLLTLLLDNGEFDEMQRLLDSNVNQWPNISEYRQLQARLHLEKGDKQQALSILQQDIPSVDASVDYHALLAFVAQQLQQDILASKHFQLLLQYNNSRADWWLGLAVSEERLGNQELALQAYNQSIRQTGLSETVKNYARQRIKIIQGY